MRTSDHPCLANGYVSWSFNIRLGIRLSNYLLASMYNVALVNKDPIRIIFHRAICDRHITGRYSLDRFCKRKYAHPPKTRYRAFLSRRSVLVQRVALLETRSARRSYFLGKPASGAEKEYTHTHQRLERLWWLLYLERAWLSHETNEFVKNCLQLSFSSFIIVWRLFCCIFLFFFTWLLSISCKLWRKSEEEENK